MSQDNHYQVCVLLAVWGEKFINDFLQLSLPSLLAPGNIPAMANAYPTRFVFLTRTDDVAVFQGHPAFQKLASSCAVEFIPIEDLIVFENYSTTLTLAYDRAIKQTGEQMLKTYFVFLTSDYIMADGSLEGLTRYIKQGYSGICAGNFQVVEEDITPFLRSKIDPHTHVMQIKPRELLKEGFQHLHPIVFASVYDQQAIHNYRANRFFLHHDATVIAGRFYLMHMLCIKPETMDYEIGASCDYSFIPEMCPSGNVAVINDSDDYLVVEAQSKNHELEYVRWGQYDIKKLAHALSEWTTPQHRGNAQHTIYFHTREVSAEEKQAIKAKLDTFVHDISAHLTSYPPMPYRHHPYWAGAIQSFHDQRDILKKGKDYVYFDLMTLTHASLLKKLYYLVFGMAPTVRRWHYRWREYRAIQQALTAHITPENSDRTLVLYDSYQADFMRYFSWLKDKIGVTHHYYLKNLLNSRAQLEAMQAGQFDSCLLLVSVGNFKNIKNLLPLIRKMLKPNGNVLVLIPNEKNEYLNVVYDFQGRLVQEINAVMNSSYSITNITSIYNNFTMLGKAALKKLNGAYAHNRKMKFLFYVFLGIPGSLLCFINNSLPWRFRKKGHCTNILLTLAPNEEVRQ